MSKKKNNVKKEKIEEKKKEGYNPVLIRTIVGFLFLFGMLMYQTGLFSAGKIEPGYKENPLELPGNYTLKKAFIKNIERFNIESGIVSTKEKANLAPQIMGLITDLKVKTGDFVKKGSVLVLINSEQMQTKLEQAKKGLNQAVTSKKQAQQHFLSAKAALEQAAKHYERIKGFYNKKASSKSQLEAAESGYKQTKAMYEAANQGVHLAESEIEKAEKFIEEAEIGVSYTSLKAPFDGVITRKFLEAGDMAIPGRPILRINDMSKLRLEANVRESLKKYISIGQELKIEVAGFIFEGLVKEIVPNVDPFTRTFVVKINFQSTKNIFVGTYGKVYIPTDRKDVIFIPKKAITKIGQLDTVLIKKEANAYRRYVRPGNYEENGNLEILSGLYGNEELIIKGE